MKISTKETLDDLNHLCQKKYKIEVFGIDMHIEKMES